MILPRCLGFLAVTSLLFGTASAQPAGTPLWDFPASGGMIVPGIHQIAPTVADDGTIYFGASSSTGGNWYALHADGTLAWVYPLETQPTTTAAIAPDGAINFASYTKLHALDPAGTSRWELDLTRPVYAPPAVAADGTLYYASTDGMLSAVTPQGQPLWSFVAPAIEIYAGPVIGGDGSVYLAAGEYLTALNPAGQEQWRYRLANSISATPAVGPDQTIYLVDNAERLYAINPDGTRRWDVIFPGYSTLTPPVVGPDSQVYLASASGRLLAVDSEGTVLWDVPTSSGIFTPPALGRDGALYYCLHWDGLLEARDSSGSPLWDLTSVPGFNTAPVLGANGVLYIGNSKDRLYAIAASAGPPTDGWPMLQRNPAHTGRSHVLPRSTLTEPADGASLLIGSVMTLTAQVVPGEAPVQQVEFLANGQLLGVRSELPYAMTWTAGPLGETRLTAVARDIAGYQSTSPEVLIRILATPPRYPLTWAALGQGTVTPAPAAPDYLPGTTLTLTANPGPYHAFSHWLDGIPQNPRPIEVTTSNHYVAVFTNTTAIETRLLPIGDIGLGGRGADRATAVRRTPDHGQILIGSSASAYGGSKRLPKFGEIDFWAIRLSATDEIEWQAVQGGSLADEPSSVLSLPDGGCLLAGSSRSPADGSKTTPNLGGYDYWIVRLDRFGTKLWEAGFGGDQDDVLTTLAASPDGAFLAGGYSSSSTGGNKTASNLGGEDFWIVRLDAEGHLLWDRTLGFTGDDRLFALQPTDDGGWLAGGSAFTPVPNADPYVRQNYWLVKLDRHGRRQWDRSFGGLGDDTLRAIAPAVTGGYLLAGQSTSGTDGNKTAPPYGYNDYWLIRIDPLGNALWDRSLGGSERDTCLDLDLAPDGGYFVGGFSDSPVSGTKTVTGSGTDFWLVKLDADGNEVAQAVFGGETTDAFAGLDLGPSDTLSAAGRSDSLPSLTKTAPLYGAEDYWSIRVAHRVAPPGTPAIYIDERFTLGGSATTATDQATIRIDTTLPEGRIFFTVDGSTPSPASPEYSAPFLLTNSAIVTALATSPDLEQSVAEQPVELTIQILPLRVISAQTWGHADRIQVAFTKPLNPASVTNVLHYELQPAGTVLDALPDPADPSRVVLTTLPLGPGDATLRVTGVTDLAGHSIANQPPLPIDTQLRWLADAGQIVPGFQDDFDEPARNPGWIPSGPGGDVYTLANGSLHIADATGDPNHLLYEGDLYDPDVHEVVARLRVLNLAATDAARGGLAVGVSTASSQGLNLVFQNNLAQGTHAKFLDDFRAWGPAVEFAWQTNQWVWMRLLLQPGAADLFAKLWPADPATPEPMDWFTWDRFTRTSDRFGFAGLTAGTAGTTAEFEVDYFLLRARGLPEVRIAPSAIPVPPLLIPEGWDPVNGNAFQAVGQLGRSYRAEWSTNLLDWTELQRGQWTEPSVRIVHPVIPPTPAAFYRVIIP